MDQTLEPIVLVLDYETVPSGGLTYRELHKQIRAALKLENKGSLRLIPFRPWYRYYTQSELVPEYRAIPCSDTSMHKDAWDLTDVLRIRTQKIMILDKWMRWQGSAWDQPNHGLDTGCANSRCMTHT